MDTSILRNLGLNDAQVKAYLFLVKSGWQTPAQMAEAIGEARTNTYNLMTQLEKLGLAEKVVHGKTYYQAKNPAVLKQLLVQRTRELNKTNAELNALLPALQSTYRLTYNQPGVVHADGAEALQIIYDDVIKSGSEPLIFPSKFDRDDPETANIIDTQIARQQKAGLGSKVLLWKSSALSSQKTELSKQHVDIEPVLREELPAQIMIYGESVAFTTFRNGVSSTVITNPEIAETMRRIFMELWPQKNQPPTPASVAGPQTGAQSPEMPEA